MHCPSSQVKFPTKQPVSFKRLLYGFPLVLHVKLSFVMVQFWEPRAKEENKASEIADVFLYTSLICHDRLAPSYSIMLVLTPRSCTEPSPSLFLVKSSPHMEVQASVWSSEASKRRRESMKSWLVCFWEIFLWMRTLPWDVESVNERANAQAS